MRNHLGIKRLQEKVQQLRDYLGARQEVIKRLLDMRRQQLLGHDQVIADAEANQMKASNDIDSLHWQASRELMEAEAHERTAAECRRRAADLTKRAQETPTGEQQLKQAQDGRRDCWSSWRERMRQETQGEVRRKYHELRRLELRLARREQEQLSGLQAEDIQYGKLPANYGTPAGRSPCATCEDRLEGPTASRPDGSPCAGPGEPSTCSTCDAHGMCDSES